MLQDGKTHTVMLAGDNGTGKTSIARIIACSVVCDSQHEPGEPCLECPSCKAVLSQEPSMREKPQTTDGDRYTEKSRKEVEAAETGFVYYKEVNGAAISKETASQLAAELETQQLFISKPNILVIDEAQEMSQASMRYLLKPFEDVRKNVFVIICTSEPRKMPKALKQRFSIINTSVLTEGEIASMIKDTITVARLKVNGEPRSIARAFKNRGIECPRDIISNLEVMAFGLDARTNDEEKRADLFSLAKLLIDRRLPSFKRRDAARSILKEITANDVVPLQIMITNYMRTVILRGDNHTAMTILRRFLSFDAKDSPNALARMTLEILSAIADDA